MGPAPGVLAARLTEAGIAISGRLLTCSLDECINPRLEFCAELGVPALPSDFSYSWDKFRRRARKRGASTAVAAVPSRDDAVPAPASAPATGRPGKAVAVKRMAVDRQPPTRVSRRKSVLTANAELSRAQEGMDVDEYR